MSEPANVQAAGGPSAGDDAPDFTLMGASGESFKLADLRGKKRVLLMFYPQDQTSG